MQKISKIIVKKVRYGKNIKEMI